MEPSITPTAQVAFGSIIAGVNALAGMNIEQILMLLAGLVVGFVAISGGVQHILELVYSWFPSLPFWVKPFLPKVISSALGYLLTYSHMDSATCTAIAGTLMLTIEGINKSPLALDLGNAATAIKGTLSPAALSDIQRSLPTTTQAELAKIIPGIAVKALVLVGAFLGLGAGLNATSLSLGPVSLSPTAGPLTIVTSPVLGATFWKAGSGAVLTSEKDIIGGIQVVATWGPYGIGAGAVIDDDVTDQATYGAGGIVAEYLPYGEVYLFWRNSGALLGITFPFGAGASINP